MFLLTYDTVSENGYLNIWKSLQESAKEDFVVQRERKIILGKRFCLEGQGLQHAKRKQREICSPMFMIKMSEMQEKQTKDGCPFV